MTSRRSRPIRHTLAIVFGILAWFSAEHLQQLQDTMGPHRQRINVRYADGVSADARRQLERQLGLVDGEQKESRTWAYLLADGSRGNIGALVRSPLVEDTAHIDRAGLRIELDLPGTPAWLRDLIARDRLRYVAWLLVAAGVVLCWSARRGISDAIVWLVAWCQRTAPRVRNGLASLVDRIDALDDRREVVAVVVLCVVFLVPLLLYGPVDDEEAGLGFFSGLVYYRDLAHGRLSYWFTDLGFGTPMPIGHRMDFHPIFGLGSLISLRAGLSGLWIVHVAIMAVYFRRLAAASGYRPGARLLLFGSYLFSVASFFIFYATDWATYAVPWTMCPIILYYLRDAFIDGAATRWWLTTVRLGVIFSFWVLNSHPGYLAPLALVFAAYVVAAAPRTLRVFGALGAASLFALTASSERVYFLVHEMGLFPADMLRTAQGGYSLLSYLTALMQPWTSVHDMRGPFVGVSVFGAAVVAALRWRHADHHMRGCTVAFIVAMGMSMIPLRLIEWTGISAVWQFRDPMVFFAVLSAGPILRQGLQARGRLVRASVGALVLLQVLQQASVISLGFRSYWVDHGRLEFYRHQGRPEGIGKHVFEAANRYGNRLYLSARTEELTRGRLSRAGIHVVTDYSLLGLDPVNGWFKNVSMDRIYPSWTLMHGVIRGERDVIENPVLLDVLGINLVMTTAKERVAPPGLTRLERLPINPELALDIFANPDAWPKAVLLSPRARKAALPTIEGCLHAGALCRHYEELVTQRLPQDVTLTEFEDGYQAHLPPSDEERLLFMSVFYRPEWVAASTAGELTIEPVADAFVGVTVPPHVEDVQLTFRPPVRIALTWVSAVSFLAGSCLLAALLWQRRTGRIRTDPSPS